MKIKPTIYAHNLFTINISYYKDKTYSWTKQADFIWNRNLKRRTYKVTKATIHYSIYDNVDFELVKYLRASTSVYYSIFINQ